MANVRSNNPRELLAYSWCTATDSSGGNLFPSVPALSGKESDMQGFWLKFTDGTSGYCEGCSANDAKLIAEKLTGKTVAGEKYKPDAKSLPYPAHPVIWQLDHPVYGLTPTFCFKPDQCAGCTSCPQNYSCTE